MKKIYMTVTAILCAAGAAFGQGSLTPPGAPVPTMKTLNEIDSAVAGVSNQVSAIQDEVRTPISEAGFTISTPGSYYLAANLEPTGSQKGITISSSDVTLDLNGFVIDGSGASSTGISIDTGYENISIENGTVRDCYLQAIYATSATDCTFRRLRISGNTRNFSTYSSLYLGSGSLVEDCRIENNTGNGINAKGNSRIVGNRITGNGGDGLKLTGTGSYVADNIVKGNANNYNFTTGNQLNLLLCEIPETLDWPCSVKLAGTLECASTGVDGITVAADDVTIDMDGHSLVGPGASSGHGISQGTTYRNLRVFNGKAIDWSGTGRAGFEVRGHNSIVNNLQASANTTGISIGTGGSISFCTAAENSDGFVLGADCTITDSKAIDNTYWGIMSVAGSKISSCMITGNGDGGVALSLGCQIEECIIRDNVDGIQATTECVIRSNTVINNTGTGIQLTSDDNLVENNVVRGNGDNYDFVADNQLNLLLCEIPETLDWPCSVKLAGTLECATTGTNGITVNADNVSIDMAGHALVGPGASSGSGIFQAPGYANLSVKNGKVTDWRGTNKAGIYAYGSKSTILSDLQASTNAYGIVSGIGSTLSACIAHDNIQNGIDVGTGSTIYGCAANGNGGCGIYVSSGSKISGCTARANTDDGITVLSASLVEGCTCSSNYGAGIHATSSDNRIEGNNVIGNDRGIDVYMAGNFITRNTASGNGTQYDIAAGNDVGTIQTSPVGAGAWDNFEF